MWLATETTVTLLWKMQTKRRHEIVKLNYNKIEAHRFQPSWTLLLYVEKQATNTGLVWAITQETKPQRHKSDISYFL